VNAQDIGLTVFVPGQYPYVAGLRVDGTSGPYGSGPNYFRPHISLTLGPGSVFEGDIYLIAGDYKQARKTICALKAAMPAADSLPPFGFVDYPIPEQQVARTVRVSGWAFDNARVATVDVFVDGQFAGTANYGEPRTDVAEVYPDAPTGIGSSFPLDTTRYSNGLHASRSA
jgi:hypothetical protein